MLGSAIKLLSSEPMVNLTLDEARAAKEAVRAKLQLNGALSIVGVGITRLRDTYAVKVNLRAPPALGMNSLPDQVDGCPVRFEVTGSIRTKEAV